MSETTSPVQQPAASPEFKSHLASSLSRVRDGFASGRLMSYDARIAQLNKLRDLITENESAINEALWSDLRKPPFECAISEQGVVIGEVEYALKNLGQWMKARTVSAPLIAQPASCEVRHDPYGVTLIISAWNYPVNLLLAPLVGAIAGGNAAVLKPSELSPATAKLMAHLVPKYLDSELFTVIEGAIPETQALLDEKFDLIFFTGSGNVGKIVMTKAAQHLTPVVLELGGKSPAIVTAESDLELAARRIAWGKYMNAGQTCVAPDYVLVHQSCLPKFIEHVRTTVASFYGIDPKASSDYCRIVNDKNFDRLISYLKDGKVVMGGESDRAARYIAPTLMTDVSLDSAIMTDEIFGPLLPIIPFTDLTEVIKLINARAKPLSLYLFTNRSEDEEQVLSLTSSGGVCINDVIMQMPVHGLPFGGVGPSGMGRYHGQFSFDTFTHSKAIMHKSTWFDAPLRYAPYTESKLKWIRRLT